MDRSLVVDFNTAFIGEATAEEKQLINELVNVWGKIDLTVAKNPAIFRRGILFGMSMQKAIARGKISLRPVREKRTKNTMVKTVDS